MRLFHDRGTSASDKAATWALRQDQQDCTRLRLACFQIHKRPAASRSLMQFQKYPLSASVSLIFRLFTAHEIEIAAFTRLQHGLIEQARIAAELRLFDPKAESGSISGVGQKLLSHSSRCAGNCSLFQVVYRRGAGAGK
jgi:hypothetical protein